MLKDVKNHRNWIEFSKDWCVEHMFFELGEHLFEIHFPRFQRPTIRKMPLTKAVSILDTMPPRIQDSALDNGDARCDLFMNAWDKAMGNAIQTI